MEVKSTFDFVNSINSPNKTSLLDEYPESISKYSRYTVNRQLSYFIDTVMFANEMNRNHHLASNMQYDFLRIVTRPRKRFSKWTKPEKNDKAEVISEYYHMSVAKAQTMVDLVSDEDIKRMRSTLDKGGVSKR